MIEGKPYYLGTIPEKDNCGGILNNCTNILILLDEESNKYIDDQYNDNLKKSKLKCNTDIYTKCKLDDKPDKTCALENPECEKKSGGKINEFIIVQQDLPDPNTKEKLYKIFGFPLAFSQISNDLYSINYTNSSIENAEILGIKNVCLDVRKGYSVNDILFIEEKRDILTNKLNVRIGFNIIENDKPEKFYLMENKFSQCNAGKGFLPKVSLEKNYFKTPYNFEFEVVNNK